MSFAASLPLPVPGEPFSLPLAFPDPSSTLPPPREPLTADQLTKLDDLIALFNSPDFTPATTVKALKARWAVDAGQSRSLTSRLFRAAPVIDDSEVLKALDDKEKCYWSREAFLRCLRACKWHYGDAVKRAEETLVWRREFCGGVEKMAPELVSHEGETGKELVFGHDLNFRPVLYMHPYRQNTATSMSQINFVVWCLERTIDLCPPTDPPTETLCLCIDFGANRTESSSQPTSLGQAKKVLDILQTYYCERLGRAICVHIPGIFWPFYTLVGPFVDPVTKDKIRFLKGEPDATELVPPMQLQALFGGGVDFEYDHNTYFPALTKLCDERKAENLARWRQYGENKCGLSESIIRGAVVPGAEAVKVPTAGGEVEPVEGEVEFVDAPIAEKEELVKAVEGITLGEEQAVQT